MSKQAFQMSLMELKSEHFEMSESEGERLFKYLTKSQNVSGLTVSMGALADKVFRAVDAILVEKVKDALLKSAKSLSALF